MGLLRDLLCAGLCARLQDRGRQQTHPALSLVHIRVTLGVSYWHCRAPRVLLGSQMRNPINYYSSQEHLLLVLITGLIRAAASVGFTAQDALFYLDCSHFIAPDWWAGSHWYFRDTK